MHRDNQVERTKESIRQAFLTLLEKQDYSSIKASDVLSQAKISKATFYRHYHDVYEVMDDCFYSYLILKKGDVEGIDTQSVEDRSYALALASAWLVKKNLRLYLACIRYGSQVFSGEFNMRSMVYSANSVKEFAESYGLTTDNCLIDFDQYAELVIALSGAITQKWARNGCPGKPETIARLQTISIRQFTASLIVPFE